jgi:predicted phosphodiesterase
MSVLVVSDLHLSANTRDEYRFKLMKWLRREAKHHELLIVNGDITEEKDRHTSVLVNRIVDEFAAIAKHTPIVFNRGNHDYTDVDNPFFAFMGHIPRVDWFHKISYVNTTVGNICVVPHTTNWKRDLSDQVRVARDCDYVLCHQTFAGTVLPGGRHVGDVPSNLFGDGPQVFSGDVHTPGCVGEIIYIGAPYTIDFGDSYDGRALIITSRTRYHFKEYHGPQKRLIELSADMDDKIAFDMVAQCRPGDIVKVRVHITSGNRSAWPEVRKVIEKWRETKECVLHSVVPIIEKGRLKSTSKSYARKSDDELLDAFAKARGLDKLTKRVGEILMQKV